MACRLQNEVCQMSGIEPHGDGYYLVKGRGLPRIDIIGNQGRVDWPQLLSPDVDVLALDEALTRLAALDPRQAQVVELRYFGGLGIDEVAESLGVSHATVERDWRTARLWLKRELEGR